MTFGLASALVWGSSDFLGGLASRRAAAFGVVLIVQLVGAILALGAATARGEIIPSTSDIAIAAGAGIGGGIGLLGLYHGLGVGRMGVVAPVTGVLAAALPVLVGIVRDGLPGGSISVGIVLALVAVVIVSRVPGLDGGRSGIEFGVMAGIGFALFNILVGSLSGDGVFAPLIALKGSSAILIVGVIVVRRSPWALPRATLPLAFGAAVLDLAGNVFYLLATQAGRLDVAVTLSSLYPVTTVILAAIVLRERVTRDHAAGIAIAAAAIALIASGSAG